MSFKPEVRTGTDPKFYGNVLAFATEEEALANAKYLYHRWTMCVDYRAVKSDEPVNYTYRDGVLKPVIQPETV